MGMAVSTGLEPVTSAVTVQRSSLNWANPPEKDATYFWLGSRQTYTLSQWRELRSPKSAVKLSRNMDANPLSMAKRKEIKMISYISSFRG